MLDKFVVFTFKGIFFITVATCLYALCFGMGTYEGALRYGARKMEIPLSKYYTSYIKTPAEDVHKDNSGQDLFERSHNLLSNVYSVNG